MSGTLPLVRGTAQALYPVTRVVSFDTFIEVGANGTERRTKRRQVLHQFTLPYTRVNAADVATFRSFVASQKGQFDSTWSLTLGSTTYGAMALEDDSFSIREEDETRTSYAFTLRARQTANRGNVAPSFSSTYPYLAVGSPVVTQFPYGRTDRHSTIKVDQPSGPRYSYALYGGGLSGFPTGALHGWELSYPAITDADLTTIENQFRGAWGRYEGFSFTDPDTAVTYSKVRFAEDSMEIRHVQPNLSSTVLRLIEYN